MSSRTAVISWLILCAALVACMVMVGGLTRLTESGLSIVEWKPLSGTFPPMNAEDWEAEFSNYKNSPQYLKVNKGMSVEEFKSIFWLEYLHRLLGRMVGLVFFMPLVWFAIRKSISRPLTFKLAGIFLLGGLQGLVGWYMVKSGLEHNPWVSPVRLAFHLGLAFIIFALILWQILNLLGDNTRHETSSTPLLRKLSVAAAGLVFFQTLLGALVAGLDAGLTYNTYPLMDGKWIPDGLFILHPLYLNIVENVALVQFNHRIVAKILAVFLAVYVIIGYRSSADNPMLRRGFMALGALFVLQFILGVLTLIKAVPITLAILHQMNALLLFGNSILLIYMLRKNKENSPSIQRIPLAGAA